jgi:hypothetical protein
MVARGSSGTPISEERLWSRNSGRLPVTSGSVSQSVGHLVARAFKHRGGSVLVYLDFEGMRIRLTDERLAHVEEHPEMLSGKEFIAGTLSNPESVVQSLSDPSARLYYRLCKQTSVGDKYLCVVVKMSQDPFIVTAYMTDAVKKGTLLWPKEK